VVVLFGDTDQLSGIWMGDRILRYMWYHEGWAIASHRDELSRCRRSVGSLCEFEHILCRYKTPFTWSIDRKLMNNRAEAMPKKRREVIAGKYIIQYTFSAGASAGAVPFMEAVGLGPSTTLSIAPSRSEDRLF
jgi:hypothetical protein